MKTSRLLNLTLTGAVLAAGAVAQEKNPEPKPAQKKMTPPAPTAPRAFQFPAHATKKLDNGLTVYVVEDHRLPLVAFALEILAGNADQKPEQAGLASLTAGLLREGTATRSSQEIAQLIDNSGGSLSASAGDDTTSINGAFMKAYTDLGLELMSDILLHPAFAPEEIQRQLQQALSSLQVQYQDAEYLSSVVSGRAMLGTHPYAYPGDGTPTSLRKLKREDLVAFHKKFYAPSRSWLAIAGDITPEEAFAKAEKYFGGWKTEAAPDRQLPAPAAPVARVVIVDKPDAVQSQIVAGEVGLKRNDPDYMALSLANQALGGSFNSRLNLKLRANEGLTYNAGSRLDPERDAGLFVASTFTRSEKTADAVKFLMDEVKQWRENPITEAEFAEAKAFLTGSYALALETAGSVAGRVLTSAIYGLPDDYWTHYRERIQALTIEQVKKAVQGHITPDKFTITVVGNAKVFSEALKAYGPVTIIPAGQVDPLSPDIRRAAKAAEPKPAAPPQN